jgi:hypothetical protein
LCVQTEERSFLDRLDLHFHRTLLLLCSLQVLCARIILALKLSFLKYTSCSSFPKVGVRFFRFRVCFTLTLVLLFSLLFTTFTIQLLNQPVLSICRKRTLKSYIIKCRIQNTIIKIAPFRYICTCRCATSLFDNLCKTMIITDSQNVVHKRAQRGVSFLLPDVVFRDHCSWLLG